MIETLETMNLEAYKLVAPLNFQGHTFNCQNGFSTHLFSSLLSLSIHGGRPEVIHTESGVNSVLAKM